jgi:cytochrome c-type biogenesis protein CcmH/NrfG
MAPPAETARNVRGVGRLGQLPSLGELADQRERLGPILASTVLPFVLVLYLALEGGGYDVVVRSEVGIGIWWIVLLGALVGVLPFGRPLGRTELVGLGLLLAFAAWTALGVSWSESSERSVEEVGRVLAFIGVLALALSAQDREALRRTVRAVGFAIAVVGALALLSRLQPSWFPAQETEAFLPGSGDRLAYPLNYWNGLAALMAIGMPLVLVIGAQSRRVVTQALATAAIPVMALVAFYTLSRGGAIEIAVALIVLLVLHPRRLEALPTLVLGAGGAALAIAAALQRDALQDNLGNAAAAQQGDEMLAVILVVCAGVALLRVALGLAVRNGLWLRTRISREAGALLAGALATLAIVAGLAAGLPDQLSNSWDDFKDPQVGSSGPERFSSASGTGRYQLWESSLDAFSSKPLTGIGPGTFEFWWSRNATLSGYFVRDAHNLYLETLAELGIPGLALLLAALGAIFVVGFGKWRRAEGYERALLAAALAAAAAFATAAAIDWVWELTVVPVAFLLLSAAVLRTSAGRRRAPEQKSTTTGVQRIVLSAIAVVSLVVISVPMLSVRDVRDSQADARAGHLEGALDAASSAERLAGYAATPSLQRSLVLEAQGNLGEAATAARDATRQESTNWRTWLTLSRIEAENGNAGAAVRAYRTARSLNPRSPLFASGTSSPSQ